MIRVIGFYRWIDGANFDYEYYINEHMNLTKEILAPYGLLRLESERYILQKSPAAGEIIAASNAYFPTLVVAQTAMAAAGPALMADLPKYTNLKPEIHLTLVISHL